MNQDYLNSIRRMAGLAPSYNAEERKRLEEQAEKKGQLLNEAANHRAPAKKISDIARDHLHIRSLSKTGDDDKDYHDIPVWALEKALKAAYKCGYECAKEGKKSDIKESADNESHKESKEGGHKPPFEPKGGAKTPKEGKDVERKEETDDEKGRKGLPKGKSSKDYDTPKNKKAEQVDEARMDIKSKPAPKATGSIAAAAKAADEKRAAKKAKKDYDKDGKVESSEDEWKGSRDKAIKKSMKEMYGMPDYSAPDTFHGEEPYDEYGPADWDAAAHPMDDSGIDRDRPMYDPEEMMADEDEEFASSYRKGDLVSYDGNVMVVHIPDAKANYVGVISRSKADASEEEKDAAVDLVKISKIRPASEEDCEMAFGGSYGTMESSSEGYNNPKGTKLKAEKDSGAHEKHPNVYKNKPHKDNSMKAKSEDKGKKGLKKLSEKDATVWGKDYGHDDQRIDKNESPDQLAAADTGTDIKVSVPNEHKRALREEITKLRKEADRVHIRDPHGSEFYGHTADAFENLLMHLEEGTQRALMLAQIDMNRIMGPMQQRLPNEVYMYIVRGGKPAALTELFKEVKVKKEKGADPSKEDYTK